MDFHENAPSMPHDEIIANLKTTILELQATIFELREVNKQQAAIIQRKAATIECQQREIAEFKERLNKNSRNSSQHPSSDGFAKPSSPCKKSGKKPGGQNGHTGHGFSVTAPVTDTVIHKPEQCSGCPWNGECVSCGRSPARNVIDVEISTTVIRHYAEKFACPLLDDKVISGRFPEGINSSIQCGDGVRALAIALTTVGMMSVDRPHQILSGVLALPISTGTIANMFAAFRL